MQYDPNLKKQQETKKTESHLMKQGVKEKFANTFLADDISSVWNYVKEDIVKPSIRDVTYRIFDGFIRGIFYGNSGSGPSTSNYGGFSTSYSQYNSYFGKNDNSSNYAKAGSASKSQFTNVAFADRGFAERTLDKMRGEIMATGRVSVAQFYDFAEVTTSNYMSDRWGWIGNDLDNTRTVILPNGEYSINLPKPRPIQ